MLDVHEVCGSIPHGPTEKGIATRFLFVLREYAEPRIESLHVLARNRLSICGE